MPSLLRTNSLAAQVKLRLLFQPWRSNLSSIRPASSLRKLVWCEATNSKLAKRRTRVAEVSLPDVLAEVESYLRHDRGQYSYLEMPPHQTARFAELLGVVRSELTALVGRANMVIRFWRDDPIEWQFSYLFVGPSGAFVFIGWGSD